MRRSIWKFGATRNSSAGFAALAVAVLAGCGESGAPTTTGDTCLNAVRFAISDTSGGGLADGGLLSRLYQADVPRHESESNAPRSVHAELPGDFAALSSPDARKAMFISVVLPIIHRVNQEILCGRRLVEAAASCRHSRCPTGMNLQVRIARLHERYRTGGDIAVLRKRLDIVPPSLAIAQAAIESGWGTSRFATKGNALFGQRTTNPERGMRPTQLPPATPVRVAAFDHLTASVESYVHNLNTHPAYRGFREQRAALRRDGSIPDGLSLVGTLTAYSSRREAYVRELRSIIRSNRLFAFDAALASNGLTKASEA